MYRYAVPSYLGLRSDADVFAYNAETRFDILFRHYARGFWRIIPVLCRKFLITEIRRLARGGGAASGPPSIRQVAPPVWPNTLRPKKKTRTHTHTQTHRNALIAMSTIRTPDLLVTVPVPVAVRYPDCRPVNSSAKWRALICSYLKLLRTETIQGTIDSTCTCVLPL